MDFAFGLLHQNRRNLLALLDQFNPEEANRIPAGFLNNVIWNAGHILAGHQYLLYGFYQQPLQVPEEYVQQFVNDTFPSGETTAAEYDQLKRYLRETIEQTMEDYRKGLFEAGHYDAYTSDYFGVTINNIDQALHFNNYHEAWHQGIITALRRNIKGKSA